MATTNEFIILKCMLTEILLLYDLLLTRYGVSPSLRGSIHTPKFSSESFRDDVSIKNWSYSHNNVNDSFKYFYTKLEASVD